MITSGPTWVAIDQVRVISNLASGETGFILADRFKKLGAKVTLLLGPGNFYGSAKGIRLIRFHYFSELAQLLDKELKTGRYTALIHAAAVADYQPKRVCHNKVSSRRKNWAINLVPTKKIIHSFNKYPDLFTVGFKFEPDAIKDKLLARGRMLLKKADLNLVVANSNKNNNYQAYILSCLKQYGPFTNKKKMANCLSELITKGL